MLVADREDESGGRECVTGVSCQTVIGRILFNQDIPYSPSSVNLL